MLLRRAAELLASTWRYQVEDEHHLLAAQARGTSVIYAIWHGTMLPGLWRHRGADTTILISQHGDGGRLATAMGRWGYRAARGSSTRGGAQGLRAIIRTLREGGNAAITPDGPRGPSRIVKPGIIAAAQSSGAVIVPVAAASSRAWRARSWDGFLVPRPFARVLMVYGEPLAIGRGPGALANGVTQLQERMAQVNGRAECAA